MDDRAEMTTRSTLGGGAAMAPSAENGKEGPLASIDRRLQMLGGNLEEIARRLNNHADRVHGSQPPSEARTGTGEEKGLVDRPEGALRRIFESVDNLEKTLDRLMLASDRNITLA
jgi:hypothetical protein